MKQRITYFECYVKYNCYQLKFKYNFLTHNKFYILCILSLIFLGFITQETSSGLMVVAITIAVGVEVDYRNRESNIRIPTLKKYDKWDKKVDIQFELLHGLKGERLEGSRTLHCLEINPTMKKFEIYDGKELKDYTFFMKELLKKGNTHLYFSIIYIQSGASWFQLRYAITYINGDKFFSKHFLSKSFSDVLLAPSYEKKSFNENMFV